MGQKIEYYPLTHPQLGIWYTEKLHPNTSIGNIAANFKIKGDIDYLLLERALNLFIEKNDGIRLRVIEENGEPKQYVSEYKYKKLDYKWDVEQAKIPFELLDSDLFYYALIKIDDRNGVIFVKTHHLVSDAWTMTIMANQVMDYYTGFKNGVEADKGKMPSYVEYIKSEQEYKNSARFIKDKEYWNTMFETVPEVAALKTRKSKDISTAAKRKTFEIPQKLSLKLQEYCKETKTSVPAVFMAALCMYINRVTSKDDIVFGSPVLNRLNQREKNTAGMFVCTVPVRIKLQDNMPFSVLTKTITAEWISILKHQKYPYDLLLKDIRKKYRGIVNSNVYDIMISYQNAKFAKGVHSIEHEGRWHYNGRQTESLCIHINDREDEGKLLLNYDFLVDLFYAKEIEFIHDHMIRLLWHAIYNP